MQTNIRATVSTVGPAFMYHSTFVLITYFSLKKIIIKKITKFYKSTKNCFEIEIILKIVLVCCDLRGIKVE